MERQEWLNWRKNKIGASDAPIIMKLFPYGKTPYMLWNEKLFIKEQEENFSMRRGTILEPIARECFQRKMNIIVSPEVIEHKEIGYMIATLDGIDINREIMVEIKCVNKELHKQAKNGKIPDIYYPQLQHQLEVSGLDHMYYFSFDGNDGVIVEIGKDKNYINQMIKEESDFYDCMINFNSPELTDKDFKIQGQDWLNIANEMSEISEIIKSYEKKYETLKKNLYELSGDTNSCAGKYILKQWYEKGRIDYEAIPELKNVNLDNYRKSPIKKSRLFVK